MKKRNPFFTADPGRYTLTTEKYLHYELEYYIFKESSAPSICVWDTVLNAYHNIGLIYYLYNPSEIKEDVIATIDEVTERNWGDEFIGNNFTLMSVIVNPKLSLIIYDRDSSNAKKEKAISDPTLHIRTSEFRDISVKWLEFLESQGK